jgi:hypothetical protein
MPDFLFDTVEFVDGLSENDDKINLNIYRGCYSSLPLKTLETFFP